MVAYTKNIFKPSHKRLNLEPRLLFDGTFVFVTDSLAPSQDDVTLETAHEMSSSYESASFISPHQLVPDLPESPSCPLQELAVVDASISDATTLIASLPQGLEFITIDPARSGIEQLTDALRNRSGIDVLHIFSHGSSGSFTLGTDVLNKQNLEMYSSQLALMGQFLHVSGDILLYGCDIGQDVDFVHQLSELTQADIAASSNLTGSSDYGGDWFLEVTSGDVTDATLRLDTFNGIMGLPGARSTIVNGEVFLGGNYIELGIHADGSFGTAGSKPATFYGSSGTSALGMSNDADGYNTGTDLRIDYFLPGTPSEGWAVGYQLSGTSYSGENYGLNSSHEISNTSLTNTSSGDVLSATYIGSYNSKLNVTIDYSFNLNDSYFKTVVTLTNSYSSTLQNVRYFRGFDPDNTVYMGGSYETINKIEKTIARDGMAVVSATSLSGDTYYNRSGSQAIILFYSTEPSAIVSYSSQAFKIADVYGSILYNTPPAVGSSTQSDIGISIGFQTASLSAGSSISYTYYTSLDNADITETVAALNAASATVTIDEDITHTFSPSNFMVSSSNANAIQITTAPLHGSLTYNGSSLSYSSGIATITNFNASLLSYIPTSNYNGPDSFYWKGSLDNGLNYSNSAVATSITINAVDDAPVATTMTAQVGPNSQTLFSSFSPTYTDAEDHTAVAIKIVSLPTTGSFEVYDGTGDRGDATNWTAVTGVDAGHPLEVLMANFENYRFNAGANSGTTANVNWQVVTASVPAVSATWKSSNTAIGSITIIDGNSNTAPTISLSGASTVVVEDNPTSSITMTVSDDYTPAEFLQFIFSSDNERLIDATGISVVHTNTTFTIILTPKPNAYGTANLLMGVSDGGKTSASSFTLTVTPVNDTPVAYDFNRDISNNRTFSFSTLNPLDVYGDASDSNKNMNIGAVTIADGVSAAVAASLLPTHFVIDSLPNYGIMLLNGSAVSSGDIISISQLGLLTYTAPNNYFGADRFTWHAVDQAPEGGAALVTAVKNATFFVLDANQETAFTEPFLANSLLSNEGYFNFSNIHSGDVHAVSNVTPSSGTLGLFSVEKTHDSTGSGSGGVLHWSYSISSSLISYLGANQQKVETFDFVVNDEHGIYFACSVQITILGVDTGHNITQTIRNSDVLHGKIDTTSPLKHDGFHHALEELLERRNTGVYVALVVSDVRIQHLEGRNDSFARQHGLGRTNEIVRHAVLEGAELANAVRHAVGSSRTTIMNENDTIPAEFPLVIESLAKNEKVHPAPLNEAGQSHMFPQSGQYSISKRGEAALSQPPDRMINYSAFKNIKHLSAKRSSAEHPFSQQVFIAHREPLAKIPTSMSPYNGSNPLSYLSALEKAILTLGSASDTARHSKYMRPFEEYILLK